MSKNLPL
ncbi:hypothetical protein YPPY55_3193, partial [Yersinia pestis PY-55]